MRPLLLNIRGTCGAGKSHIVHEIRRGRTMLPLHEVGRRRPVGYRDFGLFIPGHYEIAIGGLDTFKTLDDAYDAVVKFANQRKVLCEGKAQNRDLEYLFRMQKFFDVKAISLTTSEDEAIASVRRRGHNISETIIRRTWRKCQRDADELETHGVEVFRLDRDAAMILTKELLS